jgi:phage baseplate assembly protein V
MFRVGIVKQQDLATGRVRVTFPDREQMQSYWLFVTAPKTQSDKLYWMPDLGEQVVCLMDEHDEDGAVLGAVYSSVDAPPVQSADKWHVAMKDGAAFEYDRAAHALSVALPAGATLTIALNGATLSIDAAGNINLQPANADVKLATSQFTTSINQIISTFNSHVHGGVAAGTADTAAPTTTIP